MRALLLLALAASLALAGCTNVYESGEGTDVDCDAVTTPTLIDDGATSPLRCERTDNETPEDNGTSAPR